ncbi:hypothetical protein ACWDR0_22455 [Streptomyces sp. NPDC003691]
MSDIKDRLLLILLFAPESGFLIALLGGGILEETQGHAPSTATLWTIGLSGFALVAALIWYAVGRAGRSSSGLPDGGDSGDYASCGGGD